MDMAKVKTAELTGQALNWAVAQVVKPEGFVMRDASGEMDPPWVLGIADLPDDHQCRILGINRDEIDINEVWLRSLWSPSTDWNQGGPLIEQHISNLQRDVEDYSEPEMPWYAECGVFWDIGQTPLIAACRAIVAAKLGSEVEVPQGLLE